MICPVVVTKSGKTSHEITIHLGSLGHENVIPAVATVLDNLWGFGAPIGGFSPIFLGEFLRPEFF